MDTILQQLYNGEICPAEQYHPMMEKYQEMREKQFRHYDDFVKTLEQLQPPLHERFIKIMDEQLDTVPYEMSEMFIDGLRLGARMVIEVFEDKYKKDTGE